MRHAMLPDKGVQLYGLFLKAGAFSVFFLLPVTTKLLCQALIREGYF
jgi:hypothetical protein